MKHLLVLSLALALALAVTSVSAAEWVKLGSSYYDAVSTSRGGLTQRYFMQNNGGGSTATLFEADCAAKRLHVVRQTTYAGPMATGKVLSDEDRAGQWVNADESTEYFSSLKVVCAR